MLEEQYLEYSERLEPQTRGQRHCLVSKELQSQEGTIGLVEVETCDFFLPLKSHVKVRHVDSETHWNGMKELEIVFKVE